MPKDRYRPPPPTPVRFHRGPGLRTGMVEDLSVAIAGSTARSNLPFLTLYQTNMAFELMLCLTPNEFKILMFIIFRLEMGNVLTTSRQEISNATGILKNHVSTVLGELEAFHFIEKEHVRRGLRIVVNPNIIRKAPIAEHDDIPWEGRAAE